MMETDPLPPETPCSWADEPLVLKYVIPKIWTQKRSRRFGLYWSDRLGYGRLWPDPSDEDLQVFYAIDSYSAYLAGNRKDDAHRADIMSRIMLKLAYLSDHGVSDPLPSILELVASANPSICDIGCGSGKFLDRMRAHGAHAVGIDPSPVSLDAVARLGIEHHEGSGEHLPAAIVDRRFDIVTMFHSLEHCRDPLTAVKNALSLVKSNGIFVIEVPNMECIGFQVYGQCWWHTDFGRHLQFFTNRALEALAAKSGAAVLRFEYSGFTNQFGRQWILDMGYLWDTLYGDGLCDDPPPRASMKRSLSYLPRAIIANAARKYEAVRVYLKPKMG